MPSELETAPGTVGDPPSGTQVELSCDGARAVVTSVGGGIRTFEAGDEPVLSGYAADEMCSGGHGQVLAPWPNRLADGRYRFDGVEGTAALDEPERRNAIHGLVRWLEWRVAHQEAAAVTMATELVPQPGYPWRLDLETRYELSPGDGAGWGAQLAITCTARNRSSRRAPFGVGFHPYVHAGEEGLEACELELPATMRLETDDRGLPVGSLAVEGTEYDYRRGRALGGARLDDCFFGLGGGTDGTDGTGGTGGTDGRGPWSVTVRRGDGRTVTVSAGAELPYVMCYTGDTLPVEQRRKAIAVEPMSCPPNALVSGQDIVVLEPGGAWSATWRIATGR